MAQVHQGFRDGRGGARLLKRLAHGNRARDGQQRAPLDGIVSNRGRNALRDNHESGNHPGRDGNINIDLPPKAQEYHQQREKAHGDGRFVAAHGA